MSHRWIRKHSRLWLIRFTTLLLGLVVGLGLAEAVVRVSGVEIPEIRSKRELRDESHPRVVYHCYPSNPNGEFEPVPDIAHGNWHLYAHTFEREEIPLSSLHETPWCVNYENSSEWIRNREFTPEPKLGVLRIAVIGDSFVYGEGVPNDQSLCRQMERKLGGGFEIINGGQSGADTGQELDVLRKVCVKANCRRAVFVFIPNDVGLTPQLAGRQQYINDLINIRDRYLEAYRAKSWLTGHFRIAQLIASPLEMKRIKQETIQWYLDSYDPQINAPNLDALAHSFRTLAKMPNCRSVLVLFPLMEGFETGYPLTPIHRQVARMAREAGIPVFDLAPTFSGEITDTLWVHPTDHHPNGHAHKIASNAILDWLKREHPNFLQPDSPARRMGNSD